MSPLKVVCFAVALATSVSTVAAAQDEAPPALPSADLLASYRKTGANEVHGTFATTPARHPEIEQTEIDRPVYLFPDVPYTRWLLAEFKRRAIFHAKYPNTQLRQLDIAPEAKSVVRSVRTDESGFYQFGGVPSGKYIVLLDGQIDIPRDLDHLTDPTHPNAVWVRDAYHVALVSDPFEVSAKPFSFNVHVLYEELLRAAGVH